jgi:hypothetical protein
MENEVASRLGNSRFADIKTGKTAAQHVILSSIISCHSLLTESSSLFRNCTLAKFKSSYRRKSLTMKATAVIAAV